MGSSHRRWLVVFHWSLSDSKSLQSLKTLLGILADLNNTVVWIVSIRPPISNSSRLLSKILFWATIRRDSVSLLRFPFRNHVQVLSGEISPVCRLKYPYNCFSSHFYFLLSLYLFLTSFCINFLLVSVIPNIASVVTGRYYYQYNYYFSPGEFFFIPALTGGFSLESKWQ